MHDDVCFGAMLTPIGFNTYYIGVHGHRSFGPVEVKVFEKMKGTLGTSVPKIGLRH